MGGLLLLAACGGATEGETATSRASSAASDPLPSLDPAAESPSGKPEAVASLGGATAVQFDEGSGAWELVLDAVRVGEHPGFDRIVVEFTGAGVPGWSVQYVDRPRLEGSGDDVAMTGDAFLDISASHTTWPAPGYYDGPTRLRPPRGTAIDEVYVAGTFEGYTQVLAGVHGRERPFRVSTLSDPARLVVDVAAPEGD